MDPLEAPDSDLVSQALAGRQESYAALVQRHADAVYNLAYRMTNNHADARDLGQETFIRAYAKLALFDSTRSFKNWLLGICANMTKNRFRAWFRRRRAEQIHLESNELQAPAPDVRPLVVQKALHLLPESYRVAIALKHMEDLTYDEIAAILKIGVSAAKMRVQRGLELLRQKANLLQREESS